VRSAEEEWKRMRLDLAAGGVEPDFDLRLPSLAEDQQPLAGFAVEQPETCARIGEPGEVRVDERHLLLPALAKRVAPGASIRIALAPEALDEGVALVVAPEGEK